ncbi:MAG: TraY domain-containing protein [Elusimicrobia bacterium]|nr:TraY domain-containing protein [Candidatus Liberimonas magnetica]
MHSARSKRYENLERLRAHLCSYDDVYLPSVYIG